MPEVSITPLARSDLFTIVEQVGELSTARADRFLRMLDRALTRLDRFPEIGHQRPELPEVLRVISLGERMILYRVGGESVEIIRIVHSARDLRQLPLG